MQGYVAILVQRMQSISSSSDSVVDLSKWYTLLPSISYGESFGCLESGGYHP